MTNSANIAIPDACQASLVAFKADTAARALKLTIDNESLSVSSTIASNGTSEQDFDSLVDNLSREDPAFILCRLEKSPVHPEYVLVIYIPPACPIRPRTIFASGRVPIQRHLSHIFNDFGDYFIDDLKELNYKTYIQQTKKEDSALSFEEISQKQENADVVVAQVQLPTHDNFMWPVSDDLVGLLTEMSQGRGPRFIAGVANESGNGIILGGQGENLSDLHPSSPLYIAVRYDNKGSDTKVFIQYCPDNAKPREKMVSSTCKHSFTGACKDHGLEFEKSFDIRDSSEFTDANLESLINPVDVSKVYGDVKVIRKPRCPGRR